MVGLSSVAVSSLPGTRYGDLNQDFAVSVGRQLRLVRPVNL
jgi:hypothetical protein